MAERDLHSGFYGGAVLNAGHVLLRMLAEVAPDSEGRVRPELSAGVAAGPPRLSARGGRSCRPATGLIAAGGAPRGGGRRAASTTTARAPRRRRT